MQSRLNSSESFFARKDQDQFQNSYHDYSGYSSLEDEIEDSQILKSAWRQAKNKMPSEEEPKIALYCYTLDNLFYKELNRVIREWFKTKSFSDCSNFPFINYVETLISQVEFYRQNLTLYRGISNDKNVYTAVGNKVWSDQFESCSLLRKEAVKFVGNGTLYRISTQFAICVGPISEFPHEEEYIVPPGIKFVVKAIRSKIYPRKYHEVDIEMIPTRMRNLFGRMIEVDSFLEFVNKYLQRSKVNNVSLREFAYDESSDSDDSLDSDRSYESTTSDDTNDSDHEFGRYEELDFDSDSAESDSGSDESQPTSDEENGSSQSKSGSPSNQESEETDNSESEESGSEGSESNEGSDSEENTDSDESTDYRTGESHAYKFRMYL